jgi:hypothetical protein
MFAEKIPKRHWSFEDPPKLAENAATEEETMAHYRRCAMKSGLLWKKTRTL